MKQLDTRGYRTRVWCTAFGVCGYLLDNLESALNSYVFHPNQYTLTRYNKTFKFLVEYHNEAV